MGRAVVGALLSSVRSIGQTRAPTATLCTDLHMNPATSELSPVNAARDTATAVLASIAWSGVLVALKDVSRKRRA